MAQIGYYDLLRMQQRDLSRLDNATRKRALVIINARLKLLKRQLERMEPGTWGFNSQQAVIAQLRVAAVQIVNDLSDVTRVGLDRAARLAANHSATILKNLDEQMTGSVRPLSFENLEWVERNAEQMSQVRLREYSDSYARYGSSAVRSIENEIAANVITGTPWTQSRERIMEIVEDTVDGQQWKVDRILRTETSAAYNGMHLEAMRVESRPGDPMLKRLVAVFDSKTASDSRLLHGQTVPVEEPFIDVFNSGKRYMAPPNRPNDRETVIPWRASYGKFLPDDDFGGPEGQMTTPGGKPPTLEAVRIQALKDFRARSRKMRNQAERVVANPATTDRQRERAQKRLDTLNAQITAAEADIERTAGVQELIENFEI